MWRLIRILIVLALLCGLAVLAFAFVGPWLFPAEFSPPLRDVQLPIELDLN